VFAGALIVVRSCDAIYSVASYGVRAPETPAPYGVLALGRVLPQGQELMCCMLPRRRAYADGHISS
jgi:hypothetical protein